MSFFYSRLLMPVETWRTGIPIVKYLNALLKNERLTREHLKDLQFRRLRRLLIHAYETTGFYRERFDVVRFNPYNIRSTSDLEVLPPLTKDDLIGHARDLTSNVFKKEELRAFATGGSTGRHTPFLRDNACLPFKKAVEYRFMKWAGWELGDKVAYYWPALQDVSTRSDWRDRLHNRLIRRELVLPAGKLSPKLLFEHISALKRFRPSFVKAFPNPLAELARFATDENIAVPRLKGLMTVGEPLLQSQRELFECVFGCAVYNCYVSRECGHIASECESHSGLHVNADSLLVETTREGREVPSGEIGEILITDLRNFGMPFIRYRIEDFGRKLELACLCGRSLPLLGMEAGRISDFVRSPVDGSHVSGATLCHYLLAVGPNVGQLQIVQDGRDHLTIFMTKQVGVDKQREQHVVATIDRIFAGAMQVSFVEVAEIPRERSGKYAFCKNLVASP
jgi:phenylacetate-CoA ligase